MNGGVLNNIHKKESAQPPLFRLCMPSVFFKNRCDIIKRPLLFSFSMGLHTHSSSTSHPVEKLGSIIYKRIKTSM
jgi:hypothetical protein